MKIIKFIGSILIDIILCILSIMILLVATVVIIGIPIVALICLNIYLIKDIGLAWVALLIELMILDLIFNRNDKKQYTLLDYFKDKWNDIK